MTVGDERVVESACLIRLLECDSPATGSSRHSLRGIDQCVIGRGDGRDATRDGSTLRLDVPDRRVSSAHARLWRAYGRWMLEDAGSKNGTYVNWVKAKSAALEDGAIIRCGHTLFMFVASQPEMGQAPDAHTSEMSSSLPGLVSLNRDLSATYEAVAKVASTKVEVLISGESGTGKELLACGLHAVSGRKGDFVPVNCGAIPDNMVEGQLFGWRRGAFSGAVDDRPGYLRAANGGTLFLDEIGDLPLAPQAALLRALQEGEVVPVGDAKPINVETRLVAATHRDLDTMVEREEFREDLLARIRGFVAEIPPLRKRREDLGMLIAILLQRAVGEGGEVPKLSTRAARSLLSHSWPQNVRELEKCLATANALADEGRIRVEHLPEPVRTGAESAAPEPAPAEASAPVGDGDQRATLEDMLRQHKGNVAAVARAMGTSRSQVHRMLKRFEIDPKDYRD
jgi:transcriptional regulator with GAF, ATPase, and Fis domain